VPLEDQYSDLTAVGAPFGSDPGMVQPLTDGTADLSPLDALWRLGNIGLRPLSGRASGFWNADMVSEEDLHLMEKRYSQFRWEVFNVFKRQSREIPDPGWCLALMPTGARTLFHILHCQIGEITNVQTNPRGMKFGSTSAGSFRTASWVLHRFLRSGCGGSFVGETGSATGWRPPRFFPPYLRNQTSHPAALGAGGASVPSAAL
jgi:hypothetical protein